MVPRVRRGLAVLAAWMVVSGVLAAQQQDRSDATPPATKTEAPKVPTAVPPDATGLPVDPKAYLIGPEDILRIVVWREPDYSGAKGVRPDGKITMPLVGDLQAAGLTPERLAAQLKEALSQNIKDPVVTVEVLQVNSKRYTVTGAVNRPGVFPLVVPVKVFDAINASGGFREFANEKDILIVRSDGKRFHFNYKDFLKGKKLDENIFLQNGDTVFVKE